MTAAAPELDWLLGALGPAPDPRTRYLSVPAGERPRALVLDDRRAVAAYLRMTSGQDGALRRAVRATAGAFALAGVWALRSDEVRLPSGAGAEDGADRPTGVVAEIARRMGRPDMPHAVLAGTPRANRKPVVVIADDRGRPTAFAKVGWNALTRRLVDHEASVLGRRGRDGVLVRPRVLDRFEHEGRSVVVLEDLASGVPWWRPSGVDPTRAAEVARSVHDLGDVTVSPLASGPLPTALRERTSAIGTGASAERAAALVERAIDRLGSQDLVLGGVHGDLTPWNLRDRGSGVALWDWERFDPSGPAGADLVHHEYQRLLHVEGRPFPTAIGEARLRTAPILAAAGARPGSEHAVFVLHLVDLLLRYTADLPDAPPGSPLAGRVEQVAERLREDLA